MENSKWIIRHAKTKEYIEPSVEEIDYLKSLTGIDILKEYKKGYKAAKGEKNNDEWNIVFISTKL